MKKFSPVVQTEKEQQPYYAEIRNTGIQIVIEPIRSLHLKFESKVFISEMFPI